MPFQNKNSLQEMRHLNVSAELAGTMFGMIFGFIAMVACVAAQWSGNQPDTKVVRFTGWTAIVFFGTAAISIFSRVRQLDSREKKIRLVITLIVGFVVLAVDVSSMVYIEMKLEGLPGWVGWTVFSIHALVGLSCLGLFTMVRAFAK